MTTLTTRKEIYSGMLARLGINEECGLHKISGSELRALANQVKFAIDCAKNERTVDTSGRNFDGALNR